MTQLSLVPDPAKHPCRQCGQESTHRGVWQRPGQGGGWLDYVDLCELHASEAVAGDDPPRGLVRTMAKAKPPPAEPQPRLTGM